MKNKINNIALALATSCLMIGASQAGTATTTFGVTANILAPCTVNSDDMDFGNVNLEEGGEASSQLYISCPMGTIATINLSGGNHLSSGERYIAQKIGLDNYSVQYNLYTDNSYTIPFITSGDPLDGLQFTALEGPSYVDIYGEIPVQEEQPSGTYTDIIQVSINY